MASSGRFLAPHVGSWRCADDQIERRVATAGGIPVDATATVVRSDNDPSREQRDDVLAAMDGRFGNRVGSDGVEAGLVCGKLEALAPWAERACRRFRSKGRLV